MIDSLYIHTVQVIRYGKSQDAFGNMADSSSSPVGSGDGKLICRIEEYSAETQYRESGERLKNATLVYMPTTNPTILLQDEFFRNGVSIGLVVGINTALKGTSTGIDHYEYLIENP